MKTIIIAEAGVNHNGDLLTAKKMVKEAKKSGAELCGSETLISEINSGKINFDKMVATPAMMPKVGKLGKILGPKGLMPNPKSGTVTIDVDKAVKELKAGKIELRVEKNGIIHTRCGKSSFDENALVENIRSIYDTVIKARPASVKGTYLKKISVASTMGPGIKIDQGSIN